MPDYPLKKGQGKIEWEVQNGPITKNGILPLTISIFLENLV